MTTWDPDTQVQDVDVLRDINARFAGTFALNAWVGRGSLAVGDAVGRLRPEEVVGLERPQTGRYVD